MNKMLKKISVYTAAVFITAVSSSIFSTQFVISGLQSIGVDIELNTRILMTLDDFAILQIMLILIAVCFLIGFLVAWLGNRKLGGNRTVWYIAAGGVSLVATILIMEAVLGLMPIAGARTGFGLFTQLIAGGIGGFVFSHFTKITETGS